ncbi:MAG: glycosyltransferase family 4 protein [Candidatus Promineifilaceae bacterium]
MREWQQLRLCIPIPDRQQGGMYTFLQNWRTWLTQRGIYHTQDTSEPVDIFFVNSWAVPFRVVREMKKNRPKVSIIQRMDGSADDYGRYGTADMIQARVNTLTDLTIFQSQYSRFSTREKYRLVAQDGPVIYNPVDIKTFTPHGSKRDLHGKTKVCVVSFSTNKLKGTWQIGALASQNPQTTFILCGHFPPQPDLPNIQQLGLLNRAELAETMRSCDAFLHLADNDPCPNVVTEALASGLPVLYRDSGGTPELVSNAGKPTTISTFKHDLAAIMSAHNYYRLRARTRAVTQFAPDLIFPQYMQAIADAQVSPMPSWLTLGRLQCEGYPVFACHPRYIQTWGRQQTKRFDARMTTFKHWLYGKDES